jgi:hypothetical protein
MNNLNSLSKEIDSLENEYLKLVKSTRSQKKGHEQEKKSNHWKVRNLN